jgi:hypothetical protein
MTRGLAWCCERRAECRPVGARGFGAGFSGPFRARLPQVLALRAEHDGGPVVGLLGRHAGWWLAGGWARPRAVAFAGADGLARCVLGRGVGGCFWVVVDVSGFVE